MATPKDAPPTETLPCTNCGTKSLALVGRQTPARCTRCGRVIEPKEKAPIVSDPADVIDVETIRPHSVSRPRSTS